VETLDELVPVLKREVAVPGAFDSLFPDTSDADLTAALADAFWEARLDGYFPDVTLDPDDGSLTPELDRVYGALIVIYAGIRILLNEIRNRATHYRAEASGAVYERDQSAQMLSELLKSLQARKKQLLEILIGTPTTTTGVITVDAYLARTMPAYYGLQLEP